MSRLNIHQAAASGREPRYPVEVARSWVSVSQHVPLDLPSSLTHLSGASPTVTPVSSAAEVVPMGSGWRHTTAYTDTQLLACFCKRLTQM